MDEFKAFGSECGITTFLQRVSYLNHVIFPDVRSSSFVLFIMLLPVLYFEQYMIYSVGLIPSQFYNVIGSKDIKGFYGILIYTISFVFTIALVKGIRWFLQHLLKITWSKFLYEFLHRMYFLHGNYFKVSISGFRGHDASSIITHNVDKFCTFYSELLPDICSLPFLAILYTYILFMNLGWTGVLAIYGFITISKAVTVCLMTPMLRYAPVYEQKLTKFRLHHDHIRANSESLAFCDCTEVEFERASEKLNELISAEKQLGRCKLGWYIVINAFDYLGSALSYIVLFMPVYKSLYNNDDAVQISVLISKNSFFVIYLISLLTSLMTLWERIATLTKIVHEIYELAELLENLTKDADAEPSLALSRIQKLEFQGWSLKNGYNKSALNKSHSDER